MPGNMLIGLDSAKDKAFLWGAERLQELLLTKGAEGPQYLLKAYGAWESCAPNEHPTAFGVSWAGQGGCGKVRVTHAAEVPQSSIFPGQPGPQAARSKQQSDPMQHQPAWGRGAGRWGSWSEGGNKGCVSLSTRGPVPSTARLEAIPPLLSPVSWRNTGQKSCCLPVWWECEMYSSGASRAGEGDPHILPMSSNSG